MKTFFCKPKIFSGPDALGELAKLKAKSVLLVTDRFFADNGTAQKIGTLIPGAVATVFSEVTPDPSVELVARGAALFQRCKPDVLLALGGGSPMDCAKAILYLQETRPLFVAIPTTSGSGSEMTSFAIVTHDGVKKPLIDEALRPDWAILDETLLQRLPKALIADTGFDVLAHDAEALVATGASGFTDALAQGSFRLCMEKLHASWTGDLAARGEVHEAASMAGLAFDHAGLGIVHALAHALGGRFHLPHGRLCAILLPEVMAFNADEIDVRKKYVALARMCGISGATEHMLLRNLIAALCRLRSSLELPGSLQQAGVSPRELRLALDPLAEAALADRCLASAPKQPSREELKDLLRQVQ